MGQTQDSDDTLEGGAGSPNQQSSATGTGQPNSAGAPQLTPELQAFIDQAVERRVQSIKDSRLGKLEAGQQDLRTQVGGLAEFAKRYQALIDKDVPPDQAVAQAQRDMEVDAMLAERRGEAGQGASGNAGSGTGETQDAATLDLLKALGLTTNEPEVAAILRSLKGQERVSALSQLKVARDSRAPTTPATGTPAPEGGTPATGGDVIAGKIQLYNELNRYPARNRQALDKLKHELDTVNWGQPST